MQSPDARPAIFDTYETITHSSQQGEAILLAEARSPLDRFEINHESIRREKGHHWMNSEELRACEFQTHSSIDRFKSLIQYGLKCKMPFDEIVSHFIVEVGQDLRGFAQEFIDYKGVTPSQFFGVIKQHGEEVDFNLLGKNYGHTSENNVDPFYAVSRMISKDERKGGVFEAWKKVERLAAMTPEGSLILFTSPSGNSGLFRENNGVREEFIYKDSRTYALEVSKKKYSGGTVIRYLDGFDIQSDFSLDEHRRLIEECGGRLFNEASANDIVREVVVLTPDNLSNLTGESTVEKGIRLMKQVRGDSEYIFQNEDRVRTFDEAITDAHNEKLLQLDDKYAKLLDDFSSVVRQYAVSPEEIDYSSIEEALALMVLGALNLDIQKQKQKEIEDLLSENKYIGGNSFSTQDEMYATQNRYQDLVYRHGIDGAAQVIMFEDRNSLIAGFERAKNASANCPPPDYTNPFAVSSSGEGFSLSLLAGRSGFWSFGGQMTAEEAKNDPNLCRCSEGQGKPHFHCPAKKKDGSFCKLPINVGENVTECKCGQGKTC